MNPALPKSRPCVQKLGNARWHYVYLLGSIATDWIYRLYR
jgi:hypothetical protein